MYVYLGETSPYASAAMITMFIALAVISLIGTLLALNGIASKRHREQLEKRQATKTHRANNA